MDALKTAYAEYSLVFKPNPNIYSKEEDIILSTVYRQNKFRFLLGCFWVAFVIVIFFSSFVISIGCLATADQEKDNGEWLQITVGVLILILFMPLMFCLTIFLPHFFISAITVSKDGIVLPRSILLLRQYVSFSDITSLNVDTNGYVVFKTRNDKKYSVSSNVEGFPQVLWYITEKYKNINCDEFIERRILRWENSRENATESNSLLM